MTYQAFLTAPLQTFPILTERRQCIAKQAKQIDTLINGKQYKEENKPRKNTDAWDPTYLAEFSEIITSLSALVTQQKELDNKLVNEDIKTIVKNIENANLVKSGDKNEGDLQKLHKVYKEAIHNASKVKKKAGEEDKANKANEILTGVEAEWKDKGLDLLKTFQELEVERLTKHKDAVASYLGTIIDNYTQKLQSATSLQQLLMKLNVDNASADWLRKESERGQALHTDAAGHHQRDEEGFTVRPEGADRWAGNTVDPNFAKFDDDDTQEQHVSAPKLRVQIKEEPLHSSEQDLADAAAGLKLGVTTNKGGTIRRKNRKSVVMDDAAVSTPPVEGASTPMSPESPTRTSPPVPPAATKPIETATSAEIIPMSSVAQFHLLHQSSLAAKFDKDSGKPTSVRVEGCIAYNGLIGDRKHLADAIINVQWLCDVPFSQASHKEVELNQEGTTSILKGRLLSWDRLLTDNSAQRNSLFTYTSRIEGENAQTLTPYNITSAWSFKKDSSTLLLKLVASLNPLWPLPSSETASILVVEAGGCDGLTFVGGKPASTPALSTDGRISLHWAIDSQTTMPLTCFAKFACTSVPRIRNVGLQSKHKNWSPLAAIILASPEAELHLDTQITLHLDRESEMQDVS